MKTTTGCFRDRRAVFSMLALVGCRIRMFVKNFIIVVMASKKTLGTGKTIVLVQYSMFFSLLYVEVYYKHIYANLLELSTGVFIKWW
jgi:hypothetical protein